MSSISSNNHAAGAFDIRNVIGALLGIYGVVLVAAWALLEPGINPETNLPKDSTYNLWTGIALIAVAVALAIWAKLRPVVVEEVADGE